jgi:rSAM/selenodomain-associated transferase 1
MTFSASPTPTSLVVMAKAPVPGRVKTRLCPPCTPREAAAVARAALADTLRAVSATDVARRVVVLDGEPGPWVPPGFEIVEQSAGGLDQRLAAALDCVAGPAFLIGMDTPQVSPRLLGRAIEDLWRPGVDAVLGPAVDGGWWGIGLRHPDPLVFLGVPVSTTRTGAAQADRLDVLGLRWRSLPSLRDVDRFDDALAVANLIARSSFGHTVALVGERVLMRRVQASPTTARSRCGVLA